MMGRELRRVPPDWVHPDDKALFDGFTKARDEWDEGQRQWLRGYREDFSKWPEKGWRQFDGSECDAAGPYTYDRWVGERPDAADYMPDWPDDERTHFQMYETCSEGSPISPIFETPEEAARWCADNDASAFGSRTMDYEGWLAICRGGDCCLELSGGKASVAQYGGKSC